MHTIQHSADNPLAFSSLPRWILIVAAGEAAGFAFPAVAGVGMSSWSAGAAVIVAAGFVEGCILGGAQYLAMHRALPGLRPAIWVALTGGGAVAAYLFGLLPSSLESGWMAWALPARFAALGVVIIVVLVSIGAAQWFELRRHLRGAGWWIVGTAVAWLAGLGLFFAIAPPLWQAGQSAGLVIGIGVLAGAAMSLAMAAVTGIAFGLLVAHDRAARPIGPPVEPATRTILRPDAR